MKHNVERQGSDILHCAKFAQHDGQMPLVSAGWQPEKLNPRAASLADGPVTPKALQGAALAIFGCPTRAFTPKEIAALHAFVDQAGCSILLLCYTKHADGASSGWHHSS